MRAARLSLARLRYASSRQRGQLRRLHCARDSVSAIADAPLWIYATPPHRKCKKSVYCRFFRNLLVDFRDAVWYTDERAGSSSRTAYCDYLVFEFSHRVANDSELHLTRTGQTTLGENEKKQH